jgi:two-component system, NtrC family, sensor histidine kinase HydH
MSTKAQGQGDMPSENLGYASVLRDCLVIALIAFDERKKITAFSPETEKLLQLKAGHALGKSCEILPAALQKIVGEVLSGKPVADRQINLSPGGRGHGAVRVHAAPLPAARGKKAGGVIFLNDLTVARRLEQNLRRLDRLANVGTLSTSMAHEIKNALVAIKTFVDLLLEKNQDAELADTVVREMKRIDALASQMLRVANPGRPTVSPVQLHKVFEYSLRLVQHQLGEKLISLRRSFAASPDIVDGDVQQLEQAFMNLLLNALEAMGPNGELTVATETLPSSGNQPSCLRVTVRDTGVGIPEENMGRLFEPFFTTKKNGTGLGLAITRRIVHEHQGDITVESAPGRGTAFHIVLPLSAQGAPGRPLSFD